MKAFRLSVPRPDSCAIFVSSFLLAANLLACLPAVAAAADPGVSPKEILIGSCCVLSGPASALGTQQLIGAQTYINYINDNGGVYGRKLVIRKYNDEYDPDKAVRAFKKLLDDKCFAGAFFVGTPTAAKHVPLAEEAKVPIVGLFTGAQLLHEPFRPHVISVRASYFDETRRQIDKVWKDLGPQKVGVIYQDDAFGKAVLTGVERALAGHNSKPVATGVFSRNTLNVDQAIGKVRAHDPDMVVLVGPYGPVAKIVKDAHAANWRPLFTTVSFVGTEALIQAAGKDAEGIVISQVVPPLTRDDLPAVVQYKKLLQKYYPDSKPNYTSFEGFVDAMVLVEGLKGAGSELTRRKLITALEAIKDRDMGLGTNMKLTYGPKRHKGLDSVYTTVVRDGQPINFFNWKLVEPK